MSAPAGGRKTVTSPSTGSPPMRCENRSTRIRCPGLSVGSIESDGIRYGLTANACSVSAKKSAAATISTSSIVERSDFDFT